MSTPASLEVKINLAGFVIHSAIHMGRPNLLCVLHNHYTPINVVASMRVGLLPLSQEACILGRCAPTKLRFATLQTRQC